jgi:hypothetical protein
VAEAQAFLPMSPMWETQAILKPNKDFIMNSIKDITKKRIRMTKFLFEFREGLSASEYGIKIVEKKNLLLLLRLENGNVIGGFSEQPLSQTKFNSGKGFIMSATNMKKFSILREREGQVIPFYNNKFIFGNDELIVYFYNMTYSVIFDTTACYFETRHQKIEDFLGSKEEKGKFASLEFHQVLFVEN